MWTLGLKLGLTVEIKKGVFSSVDGLGGKRGAGVLGYGVWDTQGQGLEENAGCHRQNMNCPHSSSSASPTSFPGSSLFPSLKREDTENEVSRPETYGGPFWSKFNDLFYQYRINKIFCSLIGITLRGSGITLSLQ